MDVRDPIAASYAVAAVACAIIAVVAWRQRAHNLTLGAALTVVMAGASWWSVSLTLSRGSSNESVAAIATLAAFAGPSALCAAFLGLGFAVARPQWVPTRALVLALLVEPALITVAALTNPWHLLVYGGPGAAQLTGAATWTYGPAFWADTVFTFVEMFLGLGFVGWAWWRASDAFRAQRLAVFVAALVPMTVNLVFILGGIGGRTGALDPTPLGLAVTGTIVWYAVFRQDLFTFAPVARALIVDQIGDAVVVISPAGKFLDLNPAADRLVRGVEPGAPADLIGLPARDLLGDRMTTSDDREVALVVEFPGGRSEFEVRGFPLIDRHRRDLGTVLVARDVTEANNQSRRLAAAHDQMVRQVATIESLRADLVELASRDSLTGLHNRRHMVETFDALVGAAEQSDAPLVAVLFDVDRFKDINDEFGHLTGDAVLVALATRLAESAPADALVARWGGEEFFVALPGADAAVGLAFAEEVRRRCDENPILVAGRTIRCALSAGVAVYPASGTTMNDVFHAADVALYEAKHSGRNRVRLYGGGPTVVPATPARARTVRRHGPRSAGRGPS
ncbi:histidine kinase N-terminal 7TM domain-containing diguanylate cyclase [Pengzhenrongella frigida]|uniref:Diguanylate cyclase n=1 Tax=Pengzhenrongella frigida TaxID=1259133 RepID=A0A4Q5N0U5_9MICO|nr:diguanylate cyclase [Cellulomonas sp. HLT2-17]RYV51665.1 diguanylate cyclase [Cellulomonas sp. HLT2-17]